MRRREFIAGLVAVAAPGAVQAQRRALPTIGFLHSANPTTFAHVVAGFRRGLKETGYVEDENLAIELRWADGQYDRLPGLAAELVLRPVAVLVAGGGSPLVAKSATTTIPIVFVMGEGDPVQVGLVASITRPGGNVTGITPTTSLLGPKRLQLLHEMVPSASVVALLVNPNFLDATTQVREAQEAAQLLRLQLHIVEAASESELAAAFATITRLHVGALLAGNDAFFNSRREFIAALAARHAIPTIYSFREYAEAGGLMSYGPSLPDAYRQAGVYVGRILNGEKPGDLPVMQPVKFEFLINLKTAKALDLEVPAKLLALSNEVIE